MTPHVASFPGPTQLFVACSTEEWEDTMLSPLFCTASDGRLGGAWERGYTS